MSASLLIRQLLKLMLYLHISFGYPYLLAIPGDLTPNGLMPSLKLLCRGSYLAYVYVAMLVLCSPITKKIDLLFLSILWLLMPCRNVHIYRPSPFYSQPYPISLTRKDI